MAAIRYRVPYELRITATDTDTGQRIGNTLYARSALQTTSPPGYGATIAGTGSTTTLLDNLEGSWLALISDVLNDTYEATLFELRSIIGKGYTTAQVNIAGMGIGTPTTITSPYPHGLVNTDTVIVAGVGSPIAINFTWPVNVTSPTTFELVGSSTTVPWTGDGFFQRVGGQFGFLYGDLTTLQITINGGITGDEGYADAMAFSVRRLNSNVGRHWRSRISMAPVAEGSVIHGSLTSAFSSTMGTALGTFTTPVQNGGTDTTGKFSPWVVVSKILALGQPQIFTQSDSWCADVTQHVCQPNLGTMLSRKQRVGS